jgi:hypothetical protein
MTEHSESTKLKMLRDAMMPMSTLAENYLKLVDFVRQVSNLGIAYSDIDRDAKKLLEEIGELE